MIIVIRIRTNVDAMNLENCCCKQQEVSTNQQQVVDKTAYLFQHFKSRKTKDNGKILQHRANLHTEPITFSPSVYKLSGTKRES